MLKHGTSQGTVYPLWKIRQPFFFMNCIWDFITSKRVCSISMLLWIPKCPSWRKKVYRKRLKKIWWEKTYKVNFFFLIYYLFSCMCYHSGFLNEQLHVRISVRASPMVGVASLIKNPKFSVVGYPWNKSKNTPLFTRVPPYVSILSAMEILETNIKEALPSQRV